MLSPLCLLLVLSAPLAYPQLQWTRQFGTPQDDAPVALAVDPAGVYTLAKSDTAVAGLPNYSLRKFSHEGLPAWSIDIRLPQAIQLYGAAADATGVYVAGLISAASIDVLVRKYDPNGSLLWSRQFGSPHWDQATAIAADSSGVYVAGYTNSALEGQTNAGGLDAFLVKLDPDGATRWIRQFGNPSSDSATAVAVTAGAVYVTGVENLPAGANGPSAGFLKAFDTSGTHLWTRPTDGSTAIDVAAAGNAVYVLQSQPLNAIRKFDSAGTPQWSREVGGDEEGINSIAADSSGVYGAGTALNPGPTRLSVEGFLAKFDTLGNLVSKLRASTGSTESLTRVSAAAGRLYAAGATGGGLTGATAGGYDAFLQSYRAEDGLYFIPMVPCRALDTAGTQQGSMQGGETRTVSLQGACNVPVTARAYVLNIGVRPMEPLGYLSVFPAGIARPLASALNSPHGAPLSNQAVVAAGTNGAVNIYSTNWTDVTVDIAGYFVTDANQGSAFYTVTPCRLLDTRSAGGGPAVTPGPAQRFPFASSCGIPSTAAALAVNATVVPSVPLAALSLWLTGSQPPTLPLLSATDGNVIAHAAVLQGGATGSAGALSTQPADFVLDSSGYFGASTGVGALRFYPVTPCRAADTRLGSNALKPGESRDFPLAGTCGVSRTAKAFAFNLTAVPAGPLAFLTAWPSGTARPLVSLLNSPVGRVVANSALTAAGISGAVSIYTTNETHLIIDVAGYFE